MSNWLSKIREEGIKEVLWEAMRWWVWPLFAPILAAVLGFAGNQPLMYIFIGMVATFAFVTHGLVRLTEWRYIRTQARFSSAKFRWQY